MSTGHDTSEPGAATIAAQKADAAISQLAERRAAKAKGKDKDKDKEALKPKVRAVLQITQYDNGYIQVNGPVTDPILFHGLLGVARDMMVQNRQENIAAAAEKEQVKGSKSWWRKVVRMMTRQPEDVVI